MGNSAEQWRGFMISRPITSLRKSSAAQRPPLGAIRDNMKLPQRRTLHRSEAAGPIAAMYDAWAAAAIWPVEFRCSGNMQQCTSTNTATSGAQDWVRPCSYWLTARQTSQSRPPNCHGPAENRGVATIFRMRDTAACSRSTYPHTSIAKRESAMRWSSRRAVIRRGRRVVRATMIRCAVAGVMGILEGREDKGLACAAFRCTQLDRSHMQIEYQGQFQAHTTATRTTNGRELLSRQRERLH
ncbi:hypothetical protein FB567DRAFT_307965 [Paraphoma chrysanthemicola]|uniref:Uncharacterized protein n=1 Tax=Paraphoma chrysanthemicola TaxID=798071 RepID=A0A8K0W0K6_9PLEO|nr:hypothetical protein FB567DRAFT_307965 [Paraphoma chrysanthemicola]